ncbi:MAG: hypothetical protein E4H11_02715 [Myxococcales bacterium]|nr:MAG: hypothetical protein E4H11_02715 [Myxococcales bacterium]
MVLDTPAGGGIRMETDPVTRAEVIATIDSDPRLASQRDRCAMYRRLVIWGRDFSEEQYARAGAQGCAGFPIAGYPWPDAVADVAAGG